MSLRLKKLSWSNLKITRCYSVIHYDFQFKLQIQMEFLLLFFFWVWVNGQSDRDQGFDIANRINVGVLPFVFPPLSCVWFLGDVFLVKVLQKDLVSMYSTGGRGVQQVVLAPFSHGPAMPWAGIAGWWRGLAQHGPQAQLQAMPSTSRASPLAKKHVFIFK